MSDGIDEELYRIAADIQAKVDAGEVVGIASVALTKDGSLLMNVRYAPGGKFVLLGGLQLLQHKLTCLIESHPL